MTTSHSAITNPAVAARSAIMVGALIGAASSLFMAMFAMIASATYQNHGFFTPLYHIASVFIDPKTLMTSMGKGMAGSNFYFDLGPAMLGVLMHMMVGAAYGVGFVVFVRAARLSQPGLLVAVGIGWGAGVFGISSFIGLPLAAAIFGSGDQISDMASMVGYGTFMIEHLIFGAALGLLLVIHKSRPAR